jgi:hypothetical protein
VDPRVAGSSPVCHPNNFFKMNVRRKRLCKLCVDVRDAAPITRVPTHVVHPTRAVPNLYDVCGQALCPTCGTRWHRGTDNRVAIVA